MIGETSYPTVARFVNVADRDTRFVIALQERPTKNANVPSSAKVLLVQKSALWCVCIAECDKRQRENPLMGRLYIFDDDQSWKKLLKDEILPALDHLSSYDASSCIPLKRWFSVQHPKLLKSVSSCAGFFCDFELHRNGFVHFKADKSTTTKASKPLTTFGGQLASSHGSSNNTMSFAEGAHCLASQAFFFLKDITHRHQHHDPARDTVTDLYLCVDGDEAYWQQATYDSLIRSVVALRRQKLDITIRSALGILAYASSFQKLVHDAASKSRSPLLEHIHDNIRESLEIQQNTVTDFDSYKGHRLMQWEIFIVFWIGILTVSLSTASIFGYKVEEPEADSIFHLLIQSFLDQPVLTTLLFVVPATIVGMTFGFLPPPRFRWFRRMTHGLVALFVTLPRHWAGIALIAIGTLMFGAALAIALSI